MWRYLSELVAKKFDYALDKSVRPKLYLLGLLHSLCTKLAVRLTRYRGFDFSAVTPFTVRTRPHQHHFLPPLLFRRILAVGWFAHTITPVLTQARRT